MKLKLTVEERILVFGLMPKQHEYSTLKELIELRKGLTFTEEETRKYDITTSFPATLLCSDCGTHFDNQGGIVPSALDGKYYCPECNSDKIEKTSEDKNRQNIAFNKEVAGDYTKQITVKARALGAIVETLETMSNTRQLTEQYMPLYEKLVLA